MSAAARRVLRERDKPGSAGSGCMSWISCRWTLCGTCAQQPQRGRLQLTRGLSARVAVCPEAGPAWRPAPCAGSSRRVAHPSPAFSSQLPAPAVSFAGADAAFWVQLHGPQGPAGPPTGGPRRRHSRHPQARTGGSGSAAGGTGGGGGGGGAAGSSGCVTTDGLVTFNGAVVDVAQPAGAAGACVNAKPSSPICCVPSTCQSEQPGVGGATVHFRTHGALPVRLHHASPASMLLAWRVYIYLR